MPRSTSSSITSIVVERVRPTAAIASVAVKTPASHAKRARAARFACRSEAAAEEPTARSDKGLDLPEIYCIIAGRKLIRDVNLIDEETELPPMTGREGTTTCLDLTDNHARSSRRASRSASRAAALAACSARAAGRRSGSPSRKPEAIPYLRELIAGVQRLAGRREGRARPSGVDTSRPASSAAIRPTSG